MKSVKFFLLFYGIQLILGYTEHVLVEALFYSVDYAESGGKQGGWEGEESVDKVTK